MLPDNIGIHMNIRFTHRHLVNNKITSHKMRNAIKFFANLLMDKSVYDELHIDIEFVTGMLKSRGHEGESYCEDWENDSKYRWFTINIDPSISRKNILLTLAHEMVHVKQYAVGELQETASSNITKWNGKKIDDDVIDYWDLPWEIDAHGREKGLYSRYVKNEKTEGKAKSNRKSPKQPSVQTARC